MNSQYWSSDLFIDQICFQDSVVFNILGFEFADYSNRTTSETIILPTAEMSEKNVILPLENNHTKKIIIYLQDKKNVFYIKRDNLLIKMDSVKLENINIMNHPFYNFSEVVLFPKDVYILYIAGDVKDNINYIPSIIEFGQNLGFKHANKIYPQIPNNCRDRAVYFVIHDPIVNKLQKGRSINLGNLPDYPKISVHLSMISSWGDHF